MSQLTVHRVSVRLSVWVQRYTYRRFIPVNIHESKIAQINQRSGTIIGTQIAPGEIKKKKKLPKTRLTEACPQKGEGGGGGSGLCQSQFEKENWQFKQVCGHLPEKTGQNAPENIMYILTCMVTTLARQTVDGGKKNNQNLLFREKKKKKPKCQSLAELDHSGCKPQPYEAHWLSPDWYYSDAEIRWV